jgi:hypothetical protein
MMNEILGSAARFNQLLTRRFGLTGGAPSPQITPEIAPVVNMPDGPELRIICAEILATGNIYCTGVALKHSVIQLTNPVGSNILVVVEQIEISNPGAAGGINASIIKLGALAGLPGAGGVCYRDTRTTISGNYTREPTAQLRYDNDPPTIGTPNLFRLEIAALSSIRNAVAVVLAPGWSVQLYDTRVAADITTCFAWREVPLAAGEVGPF